MTAPMFPRAPRATEAQCQQTLIETAMRTGWRVHAQRPARTDRGWRTAIQGHAGFPDLVLITPDGTALHVVELKRRPNHVEPHQQLWLDLFAGLGLPVHAHVWWVPEDLDTHVEWIATYATGGRRIP